MAAWAAAGRPWGQRAFWELFGFSEPMTLLFIVFFILGRAQTVWGGV